MSPVGWDSVVLLSGCLSEETLYADIVPRVTRKSLLYLVWPWTQLLTCQFVGVKSVSPNSP
jgi:hypothetical protein